MRDYGKVYTAFWQSPTVLSLSDDGKLMALYLLTTQHGNLAGCFRLPSAYIAEDLNWPIERVEKGLLETVQKGFLNRCETTKWVYLPQFLKFNPLENPNQRKAALKVYEQVPKNVAFMDLLKPFLNPSETVSKPIAVTVAITETIQEEKEVGAVAPIRKAKKTFDASEIVLPELIPSADWKNWCDDRKARGKAISEKGARQQIADLVQWASEGHKPEDVIQASIRNGWQGLFKPKPQLVTNRDVSKPSPGQATMAAFAELQRRGLA